MLPKARHIVALLFFALLLFALLYVVVQRTEPYKVAENFIASDAPVSALVGSVSRVKLKFWEGFHFISSSNGGEANFTFEVTGSERVSTVEVNLQSSAGVWRVVSADVRSDNGAVARIVGAVGLPALRICGDLPIPASRTRSAALADREVHQFTQRIDTCLS